MGEGPNLRTTIKLETTLLADDTHLSCTCDSLENLETEVNLELKKIDNRLKLNMPTLNLQKTFYIRITKYPRLPIKTPFKITLNSNEITRTTSVKYLCLWFENNLKFDTHIKKSETDLAKYAGLFYKIRDILNINILKTLYCTL